MQRSHTKSLKRNVILINIYTHFNSWQMWLTKIVPFNNNTKMKNENK